MKKYRAVATMTTYVQVTLEANNEDEAYKIAKGIDGADFSEIEGAGGWSIEIFPSR